MGNAGGLGGLGASPTDARSQATFQLLTHQAGGVKNRVKIDVRQERRIGDRPYRRGRFHGDTFRKLFIKKSYPTNQPMSIRRLKYFLALSLP